MTDTSRNAVEKLIDDAMEDGLEDYGLTLHALLDRAETAEAGWSRAMDAADAALDGREEARAERDALKAEVNRAEDAALDHAIECVTATDEYDQQLCCNGYGCGCQGGTVHEHIRHHILALRTKAPEPAQVKVQGRELAYQAYINEVTPNGFTRMDNITLYAGPDETHQRHIATQVDLAFQAGWLAAIKEPRT